MDIFAIVASIALGLALPRIINHVNDAMDYVAQPGSRCITCHKRFYFSESPYSEHCSDACLDDISYKAVMECDRLLMEDRD